MKRYLLFLSLLAISFVSYSQTDFKSNGMGYVSRSDYATAKQQFEAAKALLQIKKVDRNSKEFIDIERLIVKAAESERERRVVDGILRELTEDKLLKIFTECSSEEEAEQKKELLLSTLNKAKTTLSNMVGRFPTDNVAKSQLAGCNGLEAKITDLRRGVVEILAWKEASESNTLAAYENFLMQYPNGNYAAAAKAQVRDMRDSALWSTATELQSLQGYNSYLAEFPDGLHSEEARRLIYSIGLEEEWIAAQQHDTTRDYQAYIEKYPDSRHMSAARQKLLMCQERDFWQEQAAVNTVDAYNKYMNKYPNGSYVAAAKNGIDKITETEVWNRVVSVNTIQAYESYLKTSKLLAYKREAEIAIDDKKWAKIANSNKSSDFTAYLSGSGYKGHIDEAKGYEKLLQARNMNITATTASNVVAAYSEAKRYIVLGDNDNERYHKALELESYSEFERQPSYSSASSYLRSYPEGSHAVQVSDYLAKYNADRMTTSVTSSEYHTALSYAKTNSAQQYVKNKYEALLKQKDRDARRLKREPLHWSVGVQCSFNFATNLESQVYTLNENGYDLEMPAKQELKPKVDYGVLVGVGGHSNRLNFEVGYNIMSSSLLARPKINIVKKKYHGTNYSKRRGSDYSLMYFYVAPEARYYFKPLEYTMTPVDGNRDRADLYGFESVKTYGPKLDYGVNIGFGIGWVDAYVGYLIPNKICTIGLSIYFSNK